MDAIPSGWVDVQVNGCIGVDFTGVDLTADAFLRAAEYALKVGTGVFLPTLITAPLDVYRRNVPLIRDAVVRAGLQRHVPGVHLEGPFLSAEPGAVGAHNPDWVQPATVARLDELLHDYGDFVRLLTVAADSVGVTDLIGSATARGITVSVGHQLASSAQIHAAAAAGATAATHVGNGIPNMIHRHNNSLWPILADDRLTAMIITDGHHLPADVIRAIIRAKGVSKVVVTSDAASVVGLPPGRYNMWGNDAVLEPNGLFHDPVQKHLCGSSAMMSDCIAYLKSLDILTDEELQVVGVKNPLRLIGLLKD